MSAWTFSDGNFFNFFQPLKKTPSNSTAFENNPSQDFEELYPALNFTAFSKNYLPHLFCLMHPELNRSVCGTLIPRGPDRANIWDNVVCAHVQEGARRIKSRVSDLKQPYPCTWSALAAQCEILDTSLQPWHPTCTATLTQKSSL